MSRGHAPRRGAGGDPGSSGSARVRTAVAVVAGVAIRAAGPALLALFLVGATVGTGVAPVDRTATSLRAQVTGQPVGTAMGAESGLIDSDRDGLGNAAEREHGTDAGDPDTDGDGIPDDWEVAGETPAGAPLRGGDPLRSDLYVQLLYADGVDRLSAGEREALARAWREAPVSNPDGSTGVTVHYVQPAADARLDERVTVRRRSADTVRRLAREYYTPEYVGGYGCVVHQVAFVHVANDSFAGVGAGPGYQAFVDGNATATHGTPYSVRVGTATHELLHNVVGRFESAPGRDGGVHADRGWLSHGAFTDNQYVSAATAAELEAGFADSGFYERRC